MGDPDAGVREELPEVGVTDAEGRRGLAVLLASLLIICVCLGAALARFTGVWPGPQVTPQPTPTPTEAVPTATATASAELESRGQPIVEMDAEGADAALTPTPLPAVPGCEDLLAEKAARDGDAWAGFTAGMPGLWVSAWSADVNEVEVHDAERDGYPVVLAVPGGCRLFYVEPDAAIATRYTRGEAITITGQIERVSDLLGPLTLHLDAETVLPEGVSMPPVNRMPTLEDVDYEAFHELYAEMTAVQREAFRRRIIGQRVRWTAAIDEIGAEGRIHLAGHEASGLLWVFLDGVPGETMAALAREDTITFEAEVADSGPGPLDVGFAVYLMLVEWLE